MDVQVARALMQIGLEPSAPARNVDRNIVGAPVPARIGDYEIRDELGRGGMGVVYRAWNRMTQRVEALKMIRSRDATPEERGRFLREIETARALEHPRIVSINHDGEHAELLYYTMPL